MANATFVIPSVCGALEHLRTRCFKMPVRKIKLSDSVKMQNMRNSVPGKPGTAPQDIFCHSQSDAGDATIEVSWVQGRKYIVFREVL